MLNLFSNLPLLLRFKLWCYCALNVGMSNVRKLFFWYVNETEFEIGHYTGRKITTVLRMQSILYTALHFQSDYVCKLKPTSILQKCSKLMLKWHVSTTLYWLILFSEQSWSQLLLSEPYCDQILLELFTKDVIENSHWVLLLFLLSSNK